METRTEQGSPSAIDFLSPVAGWEAAARWNRATFDWMAKGWQQWLALVTTMPAQMVVRGPIATTRASGQGERALARSDGEAPGQQAAARKRKPRPAAKKAGPSTKARARG